MEAPTPVSALVHSSALVTGGIFLLIRFFPFLNQLQFFSSFLLIIASLTILIAGLSAINEIDMKKVIALSTLSQLGLIIISLALGIPSLTLFHLLTHALFKALLFITAGRIILYASHNQDLRLIGLSSPSIPITSTSILIANIALFGAPFLAGFYSKDLILEEILLSHAYIIWAILWITAGLTAFYSFRLVMYVFYGKENYHSLGYHPHEAKWYVIAAMAPLGILAFSAGWTEHSFVEFITHTLPAFEGELHHSTEMILIAITSGIAISGIAFAAIKYNRDGKYFGDNLKHRFCYKLLANQYYLPYLWNKIIIQPYLVLSKFTWKEIDMKIIDTIVDVIAKGIYLGGEESRVMQTGNLSRALKWMVTGIAFLLFLIAIGLAK